MTNTPTTWRDQLANALTPGCGEYRTILNGIVESASEGHAELPLLRALAEVAALVPDPDDAQRPGFSRRLA